jgi:hypothetical protein
MSKEQTTLSAEELKALALKAGLATKSMTWAKAECELAVLAVLETSAANPAKATCITWLANISAVRQFLEAMSDALAKSGKPRLVAPPKPKGSRGGNAALMAALTADDE